MGCDKYCLINEGNIEEDWKKTREAMQSLATSHRLMDAQQTPTQKMSELPKVPFLPSIAERDIM